MPITRDFCQPHEPASALEFDWSAAYVDNFCADLAAKRTAGVFGVVEDARLKGVFAKVPGFAGGKAGGGGGGGGGGSAGLVFNFEEPWVECLALAAGAATATKVSAGRFRSEHGRVRAATASAHARDLLDGAAPLADWAVLFTSTASAGLGRYDDLPLNPDADKEALLRAWCALKPGGHAILAVAMTCKADGYVEFNAHRVYGWRRIAHIAEGFQLAAFGYKCEWLATGSITHIILRKPASGERAPALITEAELVAASAKARRG
jgi:hypothetical protein